MTTTNREQQLAAPPAHAFAVTIEEAARMVGLSRAQFYRLYLDSERVRSIHTGGRSRVIDVQELRAAYEQLRDEVRARQS